MCVWGGFTWPLVHPPMLLQAKLTRPLCVSTEERYQVETKTIAVDFGKVDIYPKVEAGLAGLEVGVLGRCDDDVIGQLPLGKPWW